MLGAHNVQHTTPTLESTTQHIHHLEAIYLIGTYQHVHSISRPGYFLQALMASYAGRLGSFAHGVGCLSVLLACLHVCRHLYISSFLHWGGPGHF